LYGSICTVRDASAGAYEVLACCYAPICLLVLQENMLSFPNIACLFSLVGSRALRAHLICCSFCQSYPPSIPTPIHLNPDQAFNWESHKKNWYRDCMGKVADWAKQGFTAIWLPPPSDSVSPQVCVPHTDSHRRHLWITMLADWFYPVVRSCILRHWALVSQLVQCVPWEDCPREGQAQAAWAQACVGGGCTQV